MPKIELKYLFDGEEELRAFIGAETVANVTTEESRTVALEPATTGAETVANVATEESRTAADATTQVVAEPEITADVDGDGLPYNADYHATPKSMTADGLWRAKRGQSDKATAARAAFKAAGGAVAAPAATAMPGMPGAAAMPVARAPEPISYDKLIDKTVGMMQRAKIDETGVLKLYGEVGIIDPASLETNESQRAALFGKLCEIEPELH